MSPSISSSSAYNNRWTAKIFISSIKNNIGPFLIPLHDPLHVLILLSWPTFIRNIICAALRFFSWISFTSWAFICFCFLISLLSFITSKSWFIKEHEGILMVLSNDEVRAWTGHPIQTQFVVSRGALSKLCCNISNNF